MNTNVLLLTKRTKRLEEQNKKKTNKLRLLALTLQTSIGFIRQNLNFHFHSYIPFLIYN